MDKVFYIIAGLTSGGGIATVIVGALLSRRVEESKLRVQEKTSEGDFALEGLKTLVVEERTTKETLRADYKDLEERHKVCQTENRRLRAENARLKKGVR